MASWSVFYINTNDMEAVIAKIDSLSKALGESIRQSPEKYDRQIHLEGQPSAQLNVSCLQDGWLTVTHYSSWKYNDWLEELSKTFNTKVIGTLAQSVSDYYYFVLYDHGSKKREIEVCYSDDSETVDSGEKFPFEGEQAGEYFEEDNAYLFDFDSIEKYCAHFGLTIGQDYDSVKWTRIQNAAAAEWTKVVDMPGHTSAVGPKKPKPWWKFW